LEVLLDALELFICDLFAGFLQVARLDQQGGRVAMQPAPGRVGQRLDLRLRFEHLQHEIMQRPLRVAQVHLFLPLPAHLQVAHQAEHGHGDRQNDQELDAYLLLQGHARLRALWGYDDCRLLWTPAPGAP